MDKQKAIIVNRFINALKELIKETNAGANSMIDLKSILKQYPNCLSSRATFKSVLMDKYPNEKRTVNILTIMFECGIINKIKSKKLIDNNELQRLVSQLENEYGIAGKYSQDAIVIWASVFGATVSVVKTQPSQAKTELSIENKPVVYVQGDVDDYEIIQKSDGYYITHFNGFEETEMTIPSLINGKIIKGISHEAFRGCVSVKKVIISEGIKFIGNNAFANCKSLEYVNLPDTLTTIGSGAFSGTGITSLKTPNNVELIGSSAFSSCYSLRNVILSDKITTISKNMFSYCKQLKSVTLPKSLIKIEKNAFQKCENLKDISIPIGTQIIENEAFEGTKLESIYIPSSVVKIGLEKINNRIFERENTFGFWTGQLTIYCSAGSAAMEYARKNNIKCAKAQF